MGEAKDRPGEAVNITITLLTNTYNIAFTMIILRRAINKNRVLQSVVNLLITTVEGARNMIITKQINLFA